MEKQKHQPQFLSSQSIVILWAVIQSVGWGLIYLLIVNLDTIMTDTLTLGFIGLFAGAVTGAMQHTLIDRGAGVQLRLWLGLTALGSAAGLMAISLETFWFQSLYVAILPIFVVPALFQWLSIRRNTRAGWLWIVGNGISSLVFVMFVILIESQGGEFLSAVIPALLQGIASGFVMVWLLRKLPKQELADEKPKMRYDEKVKVS